MGGHLAWRDARAVAYDAAVPLEPESRPLAGCGGTTLAAALVARTGLPPWDVAAMDGFAVAGDGPWSLVGEVLAGAPPAEPLALGTAVTVGTGAGVPVGTSAVLQVERAELLDGVVHGEVAAGRHLRRAGEECTAGQMLLPTGTPVTAAVLGLAAGCGWDALLVRPRPRVAALVTGDELLDEGLPRDGRVRDALGPQLDLLLSGHGGELVATTRLRDDPDLLRKSIDTADAGVIVVTGASSAGPADHLRPVLLRLGAELLVDGVDCRPGHPQLLARLADGRLVVGLPGNPLAAVVAAATLLAPLLHGLAGRVVRTHRALLGQPLAAGRGTRLVPVRLDGLRARTVPAAGAGMLLGAALADALAVVPPGTDLRAGDEVEVLPLG